MALSDNLVSYYSCEESTASDNLTDDHSTNDVVNQSGSISSATGKVANGRDFELDGDDWFAGSFAAFNFGDADFTLQAWVNLETKAASMCLCGIYQNSAAERKYLLLYDSSADRFQFVVSNDGTNTTGVNADASLGSPSTATWYLVHAWHDSVNNQIGIAVNAGTADLTAHTTGIFSSGGNSFGVGGFYTGASGPSFPLDGIIDEVGIWGRVLSGAERTELYNSGSGRDYAYITGGGGGGATPHFFEVSDAMLIR